MDSVPACGAGYTGSIPVGRKLIFAAPLLLLAVPALPARAKPWGENEELLWSAIHDDKIGLAESLVKAGRTDVNARNGKALAMAVSAQYFDLVKVLIQNGSDPNLDPRNILLEAVARDSETIAEFLLDHGADPNILNSEGGFLPYAVQNGDTRLVKKLLAKGADVNVNDSMGAGTPLQLAVESDQPDMVKVLLERGADPTIHARFHDPPETASRDERIRAMLKRAVAQCRRGAGKCRRIRRKPL